MKRLLFSFGMILLAQSNGSSLPIVAIGFVIGLSIAYSILPVVRRL